MTYHVLQFPYRAEYACVDETPENIDDAFEVGTGASCKALVRGTLRARFHGKHKGMKLDDFVDNPSRWILCSERARAVIAAECDNVEVYPLELLDHKRTPVGAPYFFVQVLGTVDCVDLEKSIYKRDRAWAHLFLSVYKLVLREEAIPSDLKLFRLKEKPEDIIIRSDLVARLREAGATGFDLLDTGVPTLF